MLNAFRRLEQALARRVVGQAHLIESLMIALLSDGHLLVEGAPGLAKTRAVRTLAMLVDGSFRRIQFTPDLLPSDITGAEIYRPGDGSFEFEPGPLFHNLVLADEINRAPAKVQSALLEAMGERQVSVGRETRSLPTLFMVMATQNKIEQEGTYALPEAQLDRFMLHVTVGYPDLETENTILELAREEASSGARTTVKPILSPGDVLRARQQVLGVFMNPEIQAYLVRIVLATRASSKEPGSLAADIEYGASPRATIAIDRGARARAWLQGRDYVTPDDVQALAPDCLRHRLILTLAAESRGQTTNQLVERLLDRVPVA